MKRVCIAGREDTHAAHVHNMLANDTRFHMTPSKEWARGPKRVPGRQAGPFPDIESHVPGRWGGAHEDQQIMCNSLMHLPLQAACGRSPCWLASLRQIQICRL